MADRWRISLSPTLDSIGLLTRSAADAALAFAALTGRPCRPPHRFALFAWANLSDISSMISTRRSRNASNAALALLKAGGAEITDVKVSNLRERETLFPILLSSELIATLAGSDSKRAAI